MAIAGYFDSGDEPASFVEARVHLPRLGLSGTVDFLLDTGADATTLHPGDTGKIPIDLSTLSQDSISVRGIGGEMRYVQEEALVYIEDGDTGGWHRFSIQVHVTPLSEHDTVRGLPSVLGRDILNSCRCVFDAGQSLVSLEPRSSTHRYSGVVADPSTI